MSTIVIIIVVCTRYSWKCNVLLLVSMRPHTCNCRAISEKWFMYLAKTRANKCMSTAKYINQYSLFKSTNLAQLLGCSHNFKTKKLKCVHCFLVYSALPMISNNSRKFLALKDIEIVLISLRMWEEIEEYNFTCRPSTQSFSILNLFKRWNDVQDEKSRVAYYANILMTAINTIIDCEYIHWGINYKLIH